jgi:hypothetical protein
MLLVECNVLEKVKVINEGTQGGPTRLRLQGKFQQCDEQNNNGRIYPKNILENQVKAIQEKICDRSLVGALDHPNNDAIHLSQASHLITKLWLEKDGSVMGECEILSTPNGKIVEALINDGVKIGISSRGVGSVTEGIKGKIVNEDFKLITFDLVSDPSTRGAFPELTESIRENSQRAQEIVSKHKKDRVLLTMLESKISKALKGKRKKLTPKQRKNIDLTEPFGVITSSDLKAAREAQEPDEHDRSSAGDDGARAKVTRKGYDPERDLEKLTTGVKPIETKGKEHLYDLLSKTVGKYGTSQRAYPDKPTSKNDSVELFGNIIKERCWKGYEPTPGVEPYAKGSCKPKGSKRRKK